MEFYDSYCVLIAINWDQYVWLHQEGEKITWHENFAHAGFFRDFNTAKRVAETHLLETFGAIGFYKIVGFSTDELGYIETRNQIEKAATIIKIRKGKIKKYLYASRDSEEKIVADEKGIQEAIND
ncbi:hypothetical protein SP4011_21190 [Streptococcus parapneumoniae]|uniref:Uncharacterized protein n=1 Tax=Streptococcus parapneumoniae TaxID=2993430 RepID=A0ABN6TS68_9STRE|nr:hypothetical protein SP4011_17110 [Streptococcus sp. SP4011]BDT65702.1 hypothetical protein SP4011_21190 [Streptococcus sp. SP4011]VJC28206.1 thioredoxin/glutaredoxin [Streptococcus pneumoniae]